MAASGYEFYAETSTHGFPDDPHFSINPAGYSSFSGKLGIGTTAPSYNLDFGTGAASTIRLVGEANGTAIRVGAGAAGGCDLTLLRVDGSSTQYSGVSDSGNYGFSLKYMGSRSSYDNGLSIFADNAEAAPIEALTIIQNGKVGIGSASPAYTLDVVGNASISSNLTTPFVYAVNGFGSNGNNLIYFNSASNYAKINTNGVEAMRITSAGDVGIGTTTPSGELHVEGDVVISSGSSLKSIGGQGFQTLDFYTPAGANNYTALKLGGQEFFEANVGNRSYLYGFNSVGFNPQRDVVKQDQPPSALAILLMRSLRFTLLYKTAKSRALLIESWTFWAIMVFHLVKRQVLHPPWASGVDMAWEY